MESNFESCSVFTRNEEGGYVADPRDSGNWSSGHVGEGNLIGSNMGVGAPTLVAWKGSDVVVTAEQMRDLSLSDYEAIALSNYWLPLGCGAIVDGLDLMLFDFGWNRGITTSLDLTADCFAVPFPWPDPLTPAIITSALSAMSPQLLLSRISISGIKILQVGLGVEQDGIVGPQTLRAFEAREHYRTVAAILAITTAQVTSYQKLGNFPIYGVGWLSRTFRRRDAAVASATQAGSGATAALRFA